MLCCSVQNKLKVPFQEPPSLPREALWPASVTTPPPPLWIRQPQSLYFFQSDLTSASISFFSPRKTDRIWLWDYKDPSATSLPFKDIEPGNMSGICLSTYSHVTPDGEQAGAGCHSLMSPCLAIQRLDFIPSPAKNTNNQADTTTNQKAT